MKHSLTVAMHLLALSTAAGLAGCGSPRESAAGATAETSETRPGGNGLAESSGSVSTAPGASAEGAGALSGPVPRELIERRDAAGVRAAIDRGADVHALYEDFELHALHIATAYRAATVVQVLLDAGADPDVRAAGKTTPLINAVTIDAADAAEVLLAGGADPDLADAAGRTALILSAYLGWDASIETLLRHGADVHLADRSGRTALHNAAVKSHSDLGFVQRLLDAGADPTAVDASGRTPAQIAEEEGHAQTARLLATSG